MTIQTRRPDTRSSHESGPIFRALDHGPATWFVQCRSMEPFRMLNWGASFRRWSLTPPPPPSLSRPKRSLHNGVFPQTPAALRAASSMGARFGGEGFDGLADTWEMISGKIFQMGRVLRSVPGILSNGSEVGDTSGNNARTVQNAQSATDHCPLITEITPSKILLKPLDSQPKLCHLDLFAI